MLQRRISNISFVGEHQKYQQLEAKLDLLLEQQQAMGQYAQAHRMPKPMASAEDGGSIDAQAGRPNQHFDSFADLIFGGKPK